MQKYDMESKYVTYCGQDNPVQITLPVVNGRAGSEYAFGIQRMGVSTKLQPAHFDVIQVITKNNFAEIYSIKGTPHTLLATLHTQNRANLWQMQDDMCDQYMLGKVDAVTIGLQDHDGKPIDLRTSQSVWSFNLCIYVKN